MATINQLSQLNEIELGDLLATFVASTGVAEKASISELITYLESNIVLPVTDYTVQVEYKTATGYSVSVTDSGASMWVIVKQGDDYAAGTVVLPATPVDHQEVLLTIDSQLTALTIDGGDYTVVGAPTDTLYAGQSWMFIFHETRGYWYTRWMY